MTTPLPISETIDQAIRMFCERLQTPAHGPCEPDTCHPESLCKFQEECPPNKNLAEPVQKLAMPSTPSGQKTLSWHSCICQFIYRAHLPPAKFITGYRCG